MGSSDGVNVSDGELVEGVMVGESEGRTLGELGQ